MYQSSFWKSDVAIDLLLHHRKIAVTAAALLSLVSVNLPHAQSPAGAFESPIAPPPTHHATEAQQSDQPAAELIEARSLLRQGMTVEADRDVRAFLASHADSAEGHFLLGYVLFREIQAEASGSGTIGTGLSEFRPNSPMDDSRAAKARESLAEFTQGAKYHDPSAFDLKIVALDYVLLNDYLDADKWLTRSLEWNPEDSEGWYYLGRTKYNENRFAEAISAFEHCLRLDPKNVKAEDNLGLAYAGLGRDDEAIAAYHQAIAWQSDVNLKNAGPYIDLGDLLLDRNRPEEAVSNLLLSIQIAPREARPHELLGKAYIRLEMLSKAAAELEKAVELSPNSANLHCMLAGVYRKQGLTEKTKLAYDRCATLAESHSIPATPRP
jgi:tetratricopeptide (TPR) repeat protein